MTTITIPQLKNLNELDPAIHKHWIWGSESNYHKSCDYLQKINYCIQDLNSALNEGLTPTMKDVIFVIALVDWIKEAYWEIKKILKSDILTDFKYPNEDELKKVREFFEAIRSFVVAHPLTTSHHTGYSFDGSKICVDIRETINLMCFTKDSDWYHLDFEGLHPNSKDVPCDFILCIYDSNYNNMQFFQYIGCDFVDIFKVAELYIDKLYQLGKYLAKQKKRDWQ